MHNIILNNFKINHRNIESEVHHSHLEKCPKNEPNHLKFTYNQHETLQE